MLSSQLLNLALSYYGSSSYYNYNQGAAIAGGILAFGAALIIITLLTALGAYILLAVLQMQLFKKFNVAAWKAWVPFVNIWTFLELGGQHGWWQFVPVANLIFVIIAAYNIGLKFGKDGAFVVLYIFLPLIWFIIMALKSTTLVNQPAAPANIGGLGVAPDQTVMATPATPAPAAPTAPAPEAPASDSAPAAPIEDTVKPVASDETVSSASESPTDTENSAN